MPMCLCRIKFVLLSKCDEPARISGLEADGVAPIDFSKKKNCDEPAR